MKDKIRPIYSELQGYLSQTPLPKDSPWISESSFWNQYNETIKELNEISNKDYSKFKIEPKRAGDEKGIEIENYRHKLGGLIARLYGEYFSDEPAPFSGMPTTIIHQNQLQTQSLHVQMLLEIQSKIDEKIPTYSENSKEKSFLEKIKKSLSSVRNVMELLMLILKVGEGLGLTLAQILTIFK